MVALLAGMGFTDTLQAALIARGSGMVYDDVHNITWAADANLFKTQAVGNANLVSEIITGNHSVIDSGYNYQNADYYVEETYTTHELTGADFNTNTGEMSWWGAQAWANNLTLGGYTDWSLPTTMPVYGWQFSSQMDDLFYNQLGGADLTDIAIIHNGNYNLFTNVQSPAYWAGSELMHPNYYSWEGENYFWLSYGTNPDSASALDISYGDQYGPRKYYQLYAWAVRSGDVSAVPVPAAVWLFGSGLVGLLSFNCRKNKTVNLITA